MSLMIINRNITRKTRPIVWKTILYSACEALSATRWMASLDDGVSSASSMATFFDFSAVILGATMFTIASLNADCAILSSPAESRERQRSDGEGVVVSIVSRVVYNYDSAVKVSFPAGHRTMVKSSEGDFSRKNRRDNAQKFQTSTRFNPFQTLYSSEKGSRPATV